MWRVSELTHQNKSCSECQLDVRKIERQKDRNTDGLTERQIQDGKTFQLSYQNKSCSECKQDVRKIVQDPVRTAEEPALVLFNN